MTHQYSENVIDAFKLVLAQVWLRPDHILSPRNKECKEIRNYIIEVKNPMINLYKNIHRSSPEKYIAAELLWYFAGTNNPKFIEKYASLWKDIHNDDGTVNSAYGNLIFNEKNKHGITQYQWAIESLKKDKDSRQAIMHFNKPDHQFIKNKDQVCTLTSNFQIRDNKLHMTINMRSNDIIYGFMTDWAFFSVLQYHVYMELKQYYPEISIGTYTHISNSMHLYKKHYDLVKKMVNPAGVNDKNNTFDKDLIPLMNDTIVNPSGEIKQQYKKILEPIKNGESPDFNQKTGNTLLDWCFEKLK